MRFGAVIGGDGCDAWEQRRLERPKYAFNLVRWVCDNFGNKNNGIILASSPGSSPLGLDRYPEMQPQIHRDLKTGGPHPCTCHNAPTYVLTIATNVSANCDCVCVPFNSSFSTFLLCNLAEGYLRTFDEDAKKREEIGTCGFWWFGCSTNTCLRPCLCWWTSTVRIFQFGQVMLCIMMLVLLVLKSASPVVAMSSGYADCAKKHSCTPPCNDAGEGYSQCLVDAGLS